MVYYGKLGGKVPLPEKALRRVMIVGLVRRRKVIEKSGSRGDRNLYQADGVMCRCVD
jgi:hypothetical protein